MLDVSHWNFSHKTVITGKAVVLGNDMVAQAKAIRERYQGRLIFLVARRPTVSEILQFPSHDCLLVSEEGGKNSDELVAAVSAGVFYANNAHGAVSLFRERGLITVDLSEVDSVAQRESAGFPDHRIADRAGRLNATGDMGNGMSERQNFYLDIANQLSEAGQYEEAEKYYQKADDLSPGHPFVWNNRGGNFTRWGKLEAAERAFRRCLERDSGHAKARKNLGDVLVKKEKWQEAREQYEAALQIDEYYAQALYGLGNVFLQLKDYSKAEQCYRRAVHLDPVDTRSFINLGACLSLQEKWAEALAAYTEAQILDPVYPELAECVDYVREKLAQSR